MFANFTILTQCLCQWSFSKCIEDQVRPHVQCISLHLLSFLAGMMAYYEVKSCDRETVTPVTDRVLRNYYVAAEKVEWNYAPSGKDLITGASLTEDGRWADNSERNHCCVCLAPDNGNSEGRSRNWLFTNQITGNLPFENRTYWGLCSDVLHFNCNYAPVRCITHVVIRLLLCLPFFFCLPLNTAVLRTVLQTHFLARTMARRLEASIWKWFTKSTRMPPSPSQRLRVLLWDS